MKITYGFVTFGGVKKGGRGKVERFLEKCPYLQQIIMHVMTPKKGFFPSIIVIFSQNICQQNFHQTLIFSKEIQATLNKKNKQIFTQMHRKVVVLLQRVLSAKPLHDRYFCTYVMYVFLSFSISCLKTENELERSHSRQPTFGCFDSNSQVVTCLVFKLKIPMSKHKFWGMMVDTTHN